MNVPKNEKTKEIELKRSLTFINFFFSKICRLVLDAKFSNTGQKYFSQKLSKNQMTKSFFSYNWKHIKHIKNDFTYLPTVKSYIILR